ncbi:MAG TPA: barstar family protein [Azonexus sp.]|nr:barstar family protein [Azonexus sp.]
MNPGLLKNTARAGLYHLPPSRQTDLQKLVAETHQTLLLADVGGCKDKHDALLKLGNAFQFPIWYGVNFDALHDCLTDPAWQPGKGLVLQISGLDTLRNHDLEAFLTLIDVLQSAASVRSAAKTPLWILLTSPASGVADLPAA